MDPDFYPFEENLIKDATTGHDVFFLVDVGGGKGHDLKEMCQKYPELPGKLVLQDIKSVIDEAVASDLDGKIVPMEHDFFTEQPIRGMYVWKNSESTSTNVARCPSLLHAFLSPRLARLQSSRYPYEPQTQLDERL